MRGHNLHYSKSFDGTVARKLNSDRRIQSFNPCPAAICDNISEHEESRDSWSSSRESRAGDYLFIWHKTLMIDEWNFQFLENPDWSRSDRGLIAVLPNMILNNRNEKISALGESRLWKQTGRGVTEWIGCVSTLILMLTDALNPAKTNKLREKSISFRCRSSRIPAERFESYAGRISTPRLAELYWAMRESWIKWHILSKCSIGRRLLQLRTIHACLLSWFDFDSRSMPWFAWIKTAAANIC
jgi:hypothetical protein